MAACCEGQFEVRDLMFDQHGDHHHFATPSTAGVMKNPIDRRTPASYRRESPARKVEERCARSLRSRGTQPARLQQCRILPPHHRVERKHHVRQQHVPMRSDTELVIQQSQWLATSRMKAGTD